MEPHGLGDLTGIELTVRLVSRIGRTGGTAFVQIDTVSLNKTPALWQHSVGGQLRRGSKGGVTLPDSRIGHQG